VTSCCRYKTAEITI